MSLLVPADARRFIDTDLDDIALQLLLDAAEADIVDAAGPVGTVVEFLTAGPGDLILLSQQAASVTSVIEVDTTLNANDYELYGSGRALHRKSTGANPDYRWRGRLVVTYVPVSSLERRKATQVALVKLALDFNPALASETIGAWSQTFRTEPSYVQQRDAILAGLTSSFVLL